MRDWLLSDLGSAVQAMLLIGAQAADAWSTRRAIAGGGRELNPLMGRLVDRPRHFWVFKLACGVTLAAVLLWMRDFHPPSYLRLLVIHHGIMGPALLWNTYQLFRQRHQRAPTR